MTEYQLAAMSRVGEHGEPIFRAPSVGCSGENNPNIVEVLEECLRWHQGDPWRMGTAARRAAWTAHGKRLADALAATRSPA